ncbi:MAG: hypothetical protein ACJAYO_002704, partial [Thalassolituus oleivorans]
NSVSAAYKEREGAIAADIIKPANRNMLRHYHCYAQ